jgi:hypothetical protein
MADHDHVGPTSFGDAHKALNGPIWNQLDLNLKVGASGDQLVTDRVGGGPTNGRDLVL